MSDQKLYQALRSDFMDHRLGMMPVFLQKHQPLTPLSPSLPTALPHVCEPIPTLPLTPPDGGEYIDNAANEEAIRTALHVLSTERDALTHLGELYETDAVAQDGFVKAVNAILKTISRCGKLVVCGVGKSSKIGEKCVATMNSFGIRSTFLHPTEALHGDLGLIGPNDTILVITFSGRTSELLQLLPHLPPQLQLIAVTSHSHPATCPLFFSRSAHLSILLPAPIPTSEVQSFGLPAPTTSTTTAMALTDALALAIARRLHHNPRAVFHGYHPGGAIGASAATQKAQTMGAIAITVDSVPIVKARPGFSILTARDVLLTAAKSPSGWVRVSPSSIIAPRRVEKLGNMPDLNCSIMRMLEVGHLMVEKADWISILEGNSVLEAKDWIFGMRGGERGKDFLKEGTILGVVDSKGSVSGVVEIEDVVGEDEVRKWGDCG